MDAAYKHWIRDLKQKIQSAQIKAALSVNEELIKLYWEIGKEIVEKQNNFPWGNKVVELLAKDLKSELPDFKGFSRSNLFAMRKFYLFYKDSELVRQPAGQLDSYTESSASQIVHQAGGQLEKQPSKTKNKLVQQVAGQLKKQASKTKKLIVQQAAGQLPKESILTKIPWWHHIVIMNRCKAFNEAKFYLEQTIKNNWSRNILQIQLESDLYKRQGKAQNNFELTLPKLQGDLAKETLKDPYKFDFLTLEANVQELELERQLTNNIMQFLLELGKGFAFVGRQYPIQIGKKERKIDLLFYHLKMHCFVVIDLKMGEFEPEFAGKMNYYLSAVDDLLKSKIDRPTIGIILCKHKDSIDVEYSLRDINKPLGISEFTFKQLPKNIQKNLPTVEELENELKDFAYE